MSITVHQSGIDAVISAHANGFDGVTLSKVELWNESEKIKELSLEGVSVIEPSRIYVVAVDSSENVYEVFELRFYTDTNALYATAKNNDNSIIQAKSTQSSLVLAYTLNISAAPSTVVASGDLSMYAPPATEDVLGTAEIATQDEVDAGNDDTRIVTPVKLKGFWDKNIGENIGQVPSMSMFSHAFSNYSGEYRLPGGIYVLIGFVEMTCSTDSTVTAYTGTSTFPIAFSEIISVTLGGVYQYGQADELAYGVQSLSNTAISFRMRRIFGSQQETVKICYQVWGRRDF